MEQVCRLLSDPTRWALIRELTKGLPLPISELAKRTGRGPDGISKHIALMRKLGVVTTSYGGHYILTPGFRPPAGATTLDFGHCTIRLTTDAPAAQNV
ncbi:MAG: winged helix-turn-helix transcriptional regulator [Verrucomicrobia bacterium]|nr:winged helix-turn-helix transcriptional regulator [Verrucomicrobiota bacterium]